MYRFFCGIFQDVFLSVSGLTSPLAAHCFGRNLPLEVFFCILIFILRRMTQFSQKYPINVLFLCAVWSSFGDPSARLKKTKPPAPEDIPEQKQISASVPMRSCLSFPCEFRFTGCRGRDVHTEGSSRPVVCFFLLSFGFPVSDFCRIFRIRQSIRSQGGRIRPLQPSDSFL